MVLKISTLNLHTVKKHKHVHTEYEVEPAWKYLEVFICAIDIKEL